MAADFVDGDDVGMLQTGRRFRLGAETLHVIRRREPAGEDHLHRDDAVEADLACPVDNAHAALGHFLQQLVRTERPRQRKSRRRRRLRGFNRPARQQRREQAP